MRIGARAHDYGKHSPSKLATLLHAAGFEAAQVAIPKCIEGINRFDQITYPLLEEIKTAFSENQLTIPVLGCYINPALRDHTQRLAEVATFSQALTYSKVIGADMVGTETTHFREAEIHRKEVFALLVDSVLRMVEKAEEVDAVVGIEPVAVHTLHSPALTHELLQQVKSEKLQIIFDPVNLLTLDNIDQQEQLWKDAFDAFGDKIAAVHAKDVIVTPEGFHPVVLGTGIMQYETIFKWLVTNKPSISILREEVNPTTAKQDMAFLYKGIGRK